MTGFVAAEAAGEDTVATQTQETLEKLKVLQEKKERSESKLAALAKEESSVLSEIEALDADIAEQFKRIEDVSLALKVKESEVQKTIEKLSFYKEKTVNMQQQLETRLGALWRFGLTGTINTLYQASNMGDFFTRQAYLKQLIKNDQDFRLSYKQQITNLEAQKKLVEKEQAQAKKMKLSLDAELQKLQAKKEKKVVVLKDINGNEVKTRTLLSALEKQGQNLSAMLVELAKKEGEPPQKTVFLQPGTLESDISGFAAKKGRLLAPVKGNFLRPSKDIKDCILIAAPLGEDIRAAYDGTVVFAGQLKGYGNTIIVEHEDTFFTLVAQAAKLYRSVGEKVIEGDVIGLVGGGPWLSEGVYVALRHHETPLDPAQWFKPDSIRR